MMRLVLGASLVITILVASVAAGSARDEWALWTKSSNLWTGSESSSSASRIDAFPNKDECIARMELVINQLAAFLTGNGVHVTRDAGILYLQIPNGPNPPRRATVSYSCVPDTG